MIAEVMILICIALAILIFLAKNLIKAVILLAALNLLVAVVFYALHAPDLAVTQAAVNAALSTILFVYAIKRVGEYEEEGF